MRQKNYTFTNIMHDYLKHGCGTNNMLEDTLHLSIN